MTKRKRREGQATLELILTLFAFFTVYFMYIQSSMSFAIANFIQYATFMSARAYEAAAASQGDQLAHATAYMESMVGGGGKGRFGSILTPGSNGNSSVDGASIGPATGVVIGSGAVPASARDSNWQVGVTYDYNAKIFLAPLVPIPAASGVSANSTAELQSESWLGVEPTDQDCKAVLNAAKTRTNALTVMWDNGC